jgi:hypothetical protein
LRGFVEGRIGWPVRAVLPARDFAILFPASAAELLSGLSVTVRREHSASGYPVSREVFEIGDEGVRAIGSF